MHKRLMEPSCDAQVAKGNLLVMHQRLKEILGSTSGFSERYENYKIFCVMYIKILSWNITITTERKKLKTGCNHAESNYLIKKP
jgi:hypothetical protein